MYHNGPSAHNSEGGRLYSSSFSVILLLNQSFWGGLKIKLNKHITQNPMKSLTMYVSHGLQAKQT